MNTIPHSIKKTAECGGLKFPQRIDYANHFIESHLVAHENEIWNDKYLVSVIHRHWHGQGRNGCIFALHAARKAEDVGWHDYVITDEFLTNESKLEVEASIKAAINNPNCEVLSLLFSKVTSNEQLKNLVLFLLSIDGIQLVEKNNYDLLTTLSLRLPLPNKSLSWLMAFGPFDFFPKTRQSPIMELAIRVKPKPKIQFHKLSKSDDAAHLADLPIEFKKDIMETMWQKTIERTEKILGEKPNKFSAAKTTLVLPSDLLQGIV